MAVSVYAFCFTNPPDFVVLSKNMRTEQGAVRLQPRKNGSLKIALLLACFICCCVCCSKGEQSGWLYEIIKSVS